MAQNSKSSGILSSITSGVSSFVNEVGRGVNRAVEEVDRAWFDATNNRFRKAFSVPMEEVLYGEFWAQCLNAGKVNSCTCYVSSNYFSFVVHIPNQPATVMIPMRDVVNIQRAVSLRTSSGIPAIQTITDFNVKADALQIFTSDMKLHQFFGFLNFEKAYNSTIFTWNAFKQAQQQGQVYQGQQGYPVPFQRSAQPATQPGAQYVSPYPNVMQTQGNTVTPNPSSDAPSLTKNP